MGGALYSRRILDLAMFFNYGIVQPVIYESPIRNRMGVLKSRCMPDTVPAWSLQTLGLFAAPAARHVEDNLVLLPVESLTPGDAPVLHLLQMAANVERGRGRPLPPSRFSSHLAHLNPKVEMNTDPRVVDPSCQLRAPPMFVNPTGILALARGCPAVHTLHTSARIGRKRDAIQVRSSSRRNLLHTS